MKKKVGIVWILMLSLICFIGANAQKKVDNTGYVPDEQAAIKIAEAIWFPVYGDKINNSKPFVAKLKDRKIWIVQGTLYAQKGGVPYIEIQKSDCKILKMYHGK